MTNTVQQQYNQHQFDRLGLTVFVALAAHAILILGISFDLEDLVPQKTMPTMEITLVHSHSKDAPEDADYLAQANQKGGGNVEERVRPSSPFANPTPTTENGLAPNSQLDFSPPPLKKKEKQKEIITSQNSPLKEQSKDFKRDVPLETKSKQAAQLYERSRQFAKLRAEIQQLKQAYQKTPHHTYVTGINAKQNRFASYIEAWRDKVERVGNLNYPEAALRNNVSGDLLLDVAINPDGSIQGIKVLRSSGKAVLDKAARNIVSMAAPYPPLSKEILQDTDVLHISLVWNFKVKGLSTSIQ
jgi:protein TonB